eukprot:TRINITY_DN37103_c0_g1_i1.p1 TRINITY_DN37103_c0_g1~~TRINITY_DN37103_c0_g1_i1.p1  ORF type:complete len:149 (+),score=1.29 TRINITY_DN37103_c0_g1_i1:71-517(+)
MIRRPPRSTLSSSSAASDVYKRQGAGMEHVRLLEEEGQPGAVHISQALLEATNIPPSKIDPSLLRQTAHGVICVNWTDMLALYEIDDPVLDYSNHHFRSLDASGSLNSKIIVKALCEVAHIPVSYTHLRAHETVLDLVCRLLLEKKKM